jgi:thiamine pyrophosphokinase
VKKHITIVAGGDLQESNLEDIEKGTIIIGVDRGAWWLIEHGITPDYAIGDFDSVSAEQLKKIKEKSPNVVQYKAEKDETDLELGLLLAKSFFPDSIEVFGALGTRFDHSLAGIFLLERFQELDITYRNNNNELCLIIKKKELYKSQFRYCSFISLTETAVITLDGFKYPLQKGTLLRSQTLGISNEIVKENACVTVYLGSILCLKTRD